MSQEHFLIKFIALVVLTNACFYVAHHIENRTLSSTKYVVTLLLACLSGAILLVL